MGGILTALCTQLSNTPKMSCPQHTTDQRRGRNERSWGTSRRNQSQRSDLESEPVKGLKKKKSLVALSPAASINRALCQRKHPVTQQTQTSLTESVITMPLSKKSTPIYFPPIEQHGSFQSVRKSSSPSTPLHPPPAIQCTKKFCHSAECACTSARVCVSVFSSLSFLYALERLLSFKRRERDSAEERERKRRRDTEWVRDRDIVER